MNADRSALEERPDSISVISVCCEKHTKAIPAICVHPRLSAAKPHFCQSFDGPTN
jgi:hypothetical protein